MKLAWRCVKALLTGGQTYFLRSPSMSSFFEDLQEVRPTEIVLPPRVCTLLYENFVEDLECITQSNGSSDTPKLRKVRGRSYCVHTSIFKL